MRTSFQKNLVIDWKMRWFSGEKIVKKSKFDLLSPSSFLKQSVIHQACPNTHTPSCHNAIIKKPYQMSNQWDHWSLTFSLPCCELNKSFLFKLPNFGGYFPIAIENWQVGSSFSKKQCVEIQKTCMKHYKVCVCVVTFLLNFQTYTEMRHRNSRW